MPEFSSNCYASHRARAPSEARLRDDDGMPPERLLQSVWRQQRLLRNQLKTLDARTLRVLHPGFKNFEAGPDFRGAVIQVEDEAPRSGDVEIDLRSGGWRAHGHDRNPAFKNVILHVIWDAERPAMEGPVMALKPFLDAPLAELDASLVGDSMDALSEESLGKCCSPLRDLPPDKMEELLRQAAQVRCRTKAALFQARARQVGWEQSLWEGLFRALGYKRNVWPMQNLGESRPRWHSARLKPVSLQSRLLGLGGLLPAELPRAQGGNTYARSLWDQWWREREEFSDCALPRELWSFSGMRPANHPQRRLALAAHWLAADDLPAELERWFISKIPDARLADSLLEVLQVERDDFWSWHWTLRSARLKKPQPLLGAARVTDLAVNVILPWFWIRAVEGKNSALQETAMRRYLAWPAAEDNSVLKLARQRLLGGASAKSLRCAAAQQGLLQIVRDFCDHSNALCENCRFPEMVKEFGKV